MSYRKCDALACVIPDPSPCISSGVNSLQSKGSGEDGDESASSRAHDSSSVGDGGLSAGTSSGAGAARLGATRLGAARLRAGRRARGAASGAGVSSSARRSRGLGVVGAVGRESAGSSGRGSGSGRGVLGSRGSTRGHAALAGATSNSLALNGSDLLGVDEISHVALVLGSTLRHGRQQLGLRLGFAGAGSDLLRAARATGLGETLLNA